MATTEGTVSPQLGDSREGWAESSRVRAAALLGVAGGMGLGLAAGAWLQDRRSAKRQSSFPLSERSTEQLFGYPMDLGEYDDELSDEQLFIVVDESDDDLRGDGRES